MSRQTRIGLDLVAVVNQIEVDPKVDESKTDAAADKTAAAGN